MPPGVPIRVGLTEPDAGAAHLPAGRIELYGPARSTRSHCSPRRDKFLKTSRSAAARSGLAAAQNACRERGGRGRREQRRPELGPIADQYTHTSQQRDDAERGDEQVARGRRIPPWRIMAISRWTRKPGRARSFRSLLLPLFVNDHEMIISYDDAAAIIWPTSLPPA